MNRFSRVKSRPSRSVAALQGGFPRGPSEGRAPTPARRPALVRAAKGPDQGEARAGGGAGAAPNPAPPQAEARGAPRTVAGLGCRRGATAEAALAALAAARAAFGPGRIDALAALPLKAGEAGLIEAARRLGLPFLIVAAGPAPVLTHSAASLAAAGPGSAAEGGAGAAAGRGARLLGPRIVRGPVTCAIAIRETS